jgi:hypothetical protein
MNTISPLRRNDDPPIDDGGLPPGGAPPPNEASERHAEGVRAQALRDRYATGEGVADKTYDCDDLSDGWDHDFDACIKQRVKTPTLFATTSDRKPLIRASDVVQKKIGDCALMATLAALAATDPGRIREAIAENRNQRGEVQSYTVTLYRAESHLLRANTYSEVKVTVDATFPSGHAEERSTSDGKVIWPLVFEKAYAVFRGGYNQIHHGAFASEVMQALTGRPAEHDGFGWLGYSSAQLQGDLAAGKLVVFDTKRGAGALASGLVASHSYRVAGTEIVNGEICVVLHNASDGASPRPIPFRALSLSFQRVNVGSVR